MRRSRSTACSSICDQAVLESELDVYPATGINDYFQLCLHNKIIVGGGENTIDHSDFSDTFSLREKIAPKIKKWNEVTDGSRSNRSE